MAVQLGERVARRVGPGAARLISILSGIRNPARYQTGEPGVWGINAIRRLLASGNVSGGDLEYLRSTFPQAAVNAEQSKGEELAPRNLTIGRDLATMFANPSGGGARVRKILRGLTDEQFESVMRGKNGVFGLRDLEALAGLGAGAFARPEDFNFVSNLLRQTPGPRNPPPERSAAPGTGGIPPESRPGRPAGDENGVGAGGVARSGRATVRRPAGPSGNESVASGPVILRDGRVFGEYGASAPTLAELVETELQRLREGSNLATIIQAQQQGAQQAPAQQRSQSQPQPQAQPPTVAGTASPQPGAAPAAAASPASFSAVPPPTQLPPIVPVVSPRFLPLPGMGGGYPLPQPEVVHRQPGLSVGGMRPIRFLGGL